MKSNIKTMKSSNNTDFTNFLCHIFKFLSNYLSEKFLNVRCLLEINLSRLFFKYKFINRMPENGKDQLKYEESIQFCKSIIK